jgi:hypothetical protein
MYYHESMLIKYTINYVYFHGVYNKQTIETRSLLTVSSVNGVT